MTRFVDSIPQEDKQKILDLYYGRGRKKLHEALNRWQIAKAMGNKYTPAEILSVIYSDIEGADDEQ